MRALAIALAVLLLPLAAHAQEQERIRSFVSDVAIQPNGDLDVTETIRIVATGDQIDHGIQRDFPTSYANGLGQRTRVRFEIVSVARDGHAEPYALIGLSNGKRIRIGSADVTVPPGEHVYAIRYRTGRQLIHAADHDELYWNATGTGWTFPIDSAEARIRLPAPVRFGNRAAYTGPEGSRARDAEVVRDEPGLIVFRTTRPLPAENGLTVAAAFPKGVVESPDASRRLHWWLEDWGALAAGLASLVALGGYYLAAWARAGRGPRAGTVVPIFTPPDGLSPAVARYVSRMRFDNKAFSAAIIDLAVHGHLRIRKEEGGWLGKDTTTLERVEGGRPLGGAEQAMLESLFAGGNELVLKQDNHETLQAARAALSKELERACSSRFFVSNLGWSLWGMAAVLAAMVSVALVAMLVTAPGPFAAIPLLGLASLFLAWRIQRSPGRKLGLDRAGLFWGLALLVALACGAAALVRGIQVAGWVMFVPLAMLPLALSAFAWMVAPTREGRAVMDRIAGFKHYLGITEEARLETLHPPEKTPELFERYLPYAIALGVENHWAQKFSGVLAAAAASGATSHAMGWYSGNDNVWDDPGSFADSVGSSLASTVASAATSPSSSGGGSSGGGSSGGGGGGGGGSGW
ncbi:MAG: DUF2207 domain-containing protein [Sphingomonas sp.]|uniref:DUF2207 domain-containing protein n=1 Tax=Sphingomonas sp. TaxID=28214 RepID=UPI001B2687F6|nr:DUF2207 domain-containing protein [Sphingomonas sp.]MBO9621634.1 DUF2207 domain-containing protein [Sphingomonas sp.]